MCDLPMPCQCTLERRATNREEHIQRQDALRAMWSRLRDAGQLSEVEDALLIRQIEQEWDDAIHIASPDDPLRSLCGQYGRNLADLPEKPDSWGGCWTCLQRADELAPAVAELANA
jgi:hypothetical protein